ncbi:MAG: aminoglycoside phosphotransferase family protein [Actinomycetota bacterium]|nr:aminoglycoside phosphotransferase family protein [Actinomycetota bacterium]
MQFPGPNPGRKGHRGPLARELARDLADYLLQAPPNGTPIHGGFDAGQVLLSSDSIVLLDLDRAVKGDPAEDIGTFVAQLERGIICGELPSAKAQG